MGLDPATFSTTILPALIKGGFDAVGGALQPNPFQERVSFRGTDADPMRTLPEFQNMLRGVLGGVGEWAGRDVTLPDAKVGELPQFTGGGLPMAIGVNPASENLRSGYTLPGITLPGLSNVDYPGRITKTPDQTGPKPGSPGSWPPANRDEPGPGPEPGPGGGRGGGGSHKTAFPSGPVRRPLVEPGGPGDISFGGDGGGYDDNGYGDAGQSFGDLGITPPTLDPQTYGAIHMLLQLGQEQLQQGRAA